MLNYLDTSHQTIVREKAIPKGELITLNWDQLKFAFVLVKTDL